MLFNFLQVNNYLINVYIYKKSFNSLGINKVKNYKPDNYYLFGRNIMFTTFLQHCGRKRVSGRVCLCRVNRGEEKNRVAT